MLAVTVRTSQRREVTVSATNLNQHSAATTRRVFVETVLLSLPLIATLAKSPPSIPRDGTTAGSASHSRKWVSARTDGALLTDRTMRKLGLSLDTATVAECGH